MFAQAQCCWHPSAKAVPRRCVAAAALPKRRSSKGKAARRKEPQQLSDEELLRELNSSHLWLPDMEGDFGLDDVAAHVAGRDQPQVLAPGRPGSSRQPGGKGRKPAAAAADPQTLSDIDPSSGQPLPDWIQDLQQGGFNVMSLNGQLFLQRGTVAQQQQQQQQQQRQPPMGQPVASAAASSTQPPAARPQQQQQQRQWPAGGGSSSSDEDGAAGSSQAFLQVSDRSLSVRAEFEPGVWQQHIRGLQDSSSHGEGVEEAEAAAAAAGAWYATPSASSSSSNSSSGSDKGSSGSQAGQVRAAATSSSSNAGSSLNSTDLDDNTSSSSSGAGRVSAASIQRTLLAFRAPNPLLALLQSVFPSWAANGAWLVCQSGPGVVAGPTPAEAATCLKGLALAARRAGLNNVQLQSLAREPLVTGLVEALRLTPPRTTPQQPPDLSRRLWSIAKAYWMQSGPTAAAAAQQQLLSGALAAAGPQGGQLTGRLNPSGGSTGPALGALLAQLQHKGGGGVSKQQLAAAQLLVASRAEDQLRRGAVVSALWGMAALGGPLFFEQDMDALCRIAQAKFSRWSPTPAECSDVLWALAHSRHWTPLLPQLESCLLAAGAPAACTAAEAVTSLWAFALLGVTPTQLLQHLNTHGWTIKPEGGSGRKQPAATAVARTGSSGSSSGSTGSSSSSCTLSSLRDSQLCTLAWSLACLQQVEGPLFRAVWSEVCARGPGLATNTRQAVQLAQAALAVQLEGSYSPHELGPAEGTQQLLSAAAAAFKQQSTALQAQKSHSSYQRSIATTLARLRVMHVLEDASTGYAVDITVPSLRLAIEADGPSHFSRTPGPGGLLQQLGPTAMKARHLTRLGWTVVNVPYSEWDKVTDEQQKVAYLKQRIAAAKKGAAQP